MAALIPLIGSVAGSILTPLINDIGGKLASTGIKLVSDIGSKVIHSGGEIITEAVDNALGIPHTPKEYKPALPAEIPPYALNDNRYIRKYNELPAAMMMNQNEYNPQRIYGTTVRDNPPLPRDLPMAMLMANQTVDDDGYDDDDEMYTRPPAQKRELKDIKKISRGKKQKENIIPVPQMSKKEEKQLKKAETSYYKMGVGLDDQIPSKKKKSLLPLISKPLIKKQERMFRSRPVTVY